MRALHHALATTIRLLQAALIFFERISRSEFACCTFAAQFNEANELIRRTAALQIRLVSRTPEREVQERKEKLSLRVKSR
jgi:hypothetical protein